MDLPKATVIRGTDTAETWILLQSLKLRGKC